MCNAFSAIVRHDGKVFWKTRMDSHEDLKQHFKLKDIFLGDGKTPALCPVEITPENKDYLEPDKWVFRFDIGGAVNVSPPYWWEKRMEDDCWKAHEKWKKEAYAMINLEEARNPVHPFRTKSGKITSKEIALVKERVSVGDSVWGSVMDSVGDSVGDSVWVSVRDSVGDSVWGLVWVSVKDSVRDSVGDSVWVSVKDSVWESVWDSYYGYLGSLFRLPRNAWKYTKKIKCKGYPFASSMKLWKRGLVPAYDGKKWMLLGSPKGDGKCEILWKED